MALASERMRSRRLSNRAAAPEKVKAMRSPSRLKIAPSTTPSPGPGALGLERGAALAEAPSGLEESEHEMNRKPANAEEESRMPMKYQISGGGAHQQQCRGHELVS